MNLKKSRYNVIIDELANGSWLIYNTYTGVFGGMDEKTISVYQGIEGYDRTTEDDEETAANVDLMLRAGYIVDGDKDELATVRLERDMLRHPKDVLSLTIAVTMDCNMACPYCYEKRNLISMNDEVQQQLCSFVEAHFMSNPELKRLMVVWYGGEPLLEKQVIYNLSEKFIKLCDANEKGYSASIITNGVLLDVETAKRLVNDCKVATAQITIDGLKEMHNKRRILPSGEDSFDIITNNIDACKEFMYISVRVNTDKENADEIDGLVDYFVNEKKWTSSPSFYLSPVTIKDDDGCNVSKSVCLQGEEFADINIKAIRASYAANREKVASSFFPRRRPVFCSGEGASNYIIGPDGSFCNCFHHVNVKEQITGHISRPFTVTSNYAKWLTSDIHQKCQECEYLPMCMGGCGLYRLSDESADGEPKCFYTSFTYKDILKLAYEDYVARQIETNTPNNAVQS